MAGLLGFRCRELAHTADIGLLMSAPDGATLFGGAAGAMFGLVYEELLDPPVSASRQVTLQAADPESLLIDWLNELLFLYEVEGLAYTDVVMERWRPTQLEATVRGRRPYGPPILHIKAVTYHQILVRPVPAGWEAQLFFDI